MDWYDTPYAKVPGSCCRTNMGCNTKNLDLIYNTVRVVNINEVREHTILFMFSLPADFVIGLLCNGDGFLTS